MSGRTRTTGARVVVAIVAIVMLAGCDWNQLGGFGPAGTSFNPSEPALTASSVAHLTPGWSKPCACSSSPPLVVDGTVYIVDGYTGQTPFSLTLRAFDAVDGHVKWSTPLGASAFGGALGAVANGLVYLTVHPFDETGDRLVAIDATSGAVRFRVRPPTAGSGYTRLDPPVVDGSLVYVGATASDSTVVSAFDPTGQRIWSVVPGGQSFPGRNLAISPDGTLYTATFIGLSEAPPVNLLRGYAASDGTARSAAIVPSDIPVQSLAAVDGMVFGTWFTDFGRFGGVGGFAVHPDTGALAWTDGLFLSAVTPGVAITSNPRTGDLVAHNPTTGATVWSATQVATSVAATDQLLFFGDGAIRRLADGAVVGHVPSSDANAVELVIPSNGRIYASSATQLSTFVPAGP